MTTRSGSEPHSPGSPRALRYLNEVRRHGIDHERSNLIAMIKEAVLLGRAPVVPDLRLSKRNNYGQPPPRSWGRYYDLESTEVRLDRVLQPFTFIANEIAESFSREEMLVIDGERRITEGENSRYPLIVRDLNGYRGIWRKIELPDRERVRVKVVPSARVLELGEKIKSRLGNYSAVHVRRGDYLPIHPALVQDTSIEAIQQKLLEIVPRGETLYVLTNEPDLHYFDPLGETFEVARYFDFPELAALVDGPKPDNYLLYEVEKRILKGARERIYTFRNARHPHSLSEIEGSS